MAREFTESDLKWIKRFQKVMNDAPTELFMFVGAGITIYPERVMQKGTINPAVVDENGVSITTKMNYDGGDF